MRKKTVLFLVIVSIFYGCKDVQKTYYPNGNLKEEITYDKNGIRDGASFFYYEDGVLKEGGEYRNDKCNGEYIWCYETGQIKMKVDFIDGKEEGKVFQYYENGNISTEALFSNGKQNGITVEYYSNGRIKQHVNYFNNQQYGVSKFYYPNKQLKMYADFINDKPIFYKKYDKQGQLIDEYRYVSIELEKDTFVLGEEFKTDIKVYGSFDKEDPPIKVLWGYTDRGDPIDKMYSEIPSEKGVAKYVKTCTVVGKLFFTASIRFKEQNIPFMNTVEIVVIDSILQISQE